MGVGFTTHDNFDFSVNIQRGDFVSLDVDNDGDWDHMGFVTNVDFMYEDGYHYQENILIIKLHSIVIIIMHGLQKK